jgi:mono/diheme cytochrome c family protein
MSFRLALALGVLLFSVSPAVADEDEKMKPVPKEYADKHMPKGWWTDAKVIEDGKTLFETAHIEFEFRKDKVSIKDGCSACHAINKEKDAPKQRGARDFRVGKKMNQFTDSYWFWRISEGVPKTKMPAWKDKLSEEERWKVIAYEHTWSHDMKPADHAH